MIAAARPSSSAPTSTAPGGSIACRAPDGSATAHRSPAAPRTKSPIGPNAVDAIPDGSVTTARSLPSNVGLV